MLTGPFPNPDSGELYDMLAKANFPLLPKDKEDGMTVLDGCASLYWRDGNGSIALWAGYHGNPQEPILDIACLPAIKGKWATKDRIRKTLQAPFMTGAKKIVMETFIPKQIKMGLRLGFSMDYSEESKDLLTNWVRLELTQKGFNERYMCG